MPREVSWDEVAADESSPEDDRRPALEGAERGRRRWRATAAGTEDLALARGLPLERECPVCRSLERCGCSEAERSFVRRTRFEADVRSVARCRRCSAPLSVIYVPRSRRLARPVELSEFGALYACSLCSADAVAGLLERLRSDGVAGPQPEGEERVEG